MTYKATIHTMEIEPILQAKYQDKPGEWINKIYEQQYPYINSLYKARNNGKAVAIINTHRMNTTPEGKYIFSYKGLGGHMQDMEVICADFEIDAYIIRRMDLCLDADAPYGQTQKLTRLIALMLGNDTGMHNCYISTDPFTGEVKTLRLDNEHRSKKSGKVPATLQVEHYNRELKNQTDYAGNPIRNRFELRSMGAQAGEKHTEEDIAVNWLKRLEGLTERDMERVCQQINDMLVEKCGEYLQAVGNTSSTEINAFLRVRAADYIYTRKQLKALLDMLGIENSEAYAGNLLKRSGERFELYSWAKVRTEIGLMKRAILDFTGATQNGQKRQKTS